MWKIPVCDKDRDKGGLWKKTQTLARGMAQVERACYKALSSNLSSAKKKRKSQKLQSRDPESCSL
jgi:hypothetical protein